MAAWNRDLGRLFHLLLRVNQIKTRISEVSMSYRAFHKVAGRSTGLFYCTFPLAGVCFAAVCGLAGCGPYLSSSLDIPEIPLESAGPDARARLGTVREEGLNLAAQSISIERLVDVRQSPVIVTRNEESTELVGDVGIKVSDAIRRSLVEKGFNVSSFGDHAVRGEVRTWRAFVDSSLNGSLVSEAVIYVEVYNQREQKVFTGTFNGNAESQTPLISNSDVRDSLGKAMGQAITELTSDPAFLRAVTS